MLPLKKSIADISHHYASSQIHLAIGAALYASVAFTSWTAAADSLYLVWLGFATWYVYHQAPSWKAPWWRFSNFSEILTTANCLAAVLMIAAWVVLQKNGIACALVVTGILLTYLYFFGWKEESHPWKEHKLGKVILLSVVFSLLTIIIPLLIIEANLASVVRLTMPRILFFLALALISDQKEVQQSKGTSGRWILMVSCILLLSGLLDTLNASEFLLPFPVMAAYLLTNMATWCIMWLSLRRQNLLFYSLIVDGLLFLPWVILFFGTR